MVVTYIIIFHGKSKKNVFLFYILTSDDVQTRMFYSQNVFTPGQFCFQLRSRRPPALPSERDSCAFLSCRQKFTQKIFSNLALLQRLDGRSNIADFSWPRLSITKRVTPQLLIIILSLVFLSCPTIKGVVRPFCHKGTSLSLGLKTSFHESKQNCSSRTYRKQ